MVRLFSRPRRSGAGDARSRSGAASRGSSARRARLAVDRLEDRLTPSGETVTAMIGTLLTGRSVTVTFNATVDNPLTKGIDTVFNQGSVSGTNFATVRTDDPALPGTTDPTATAVDRAPMVAGVFVRGSAWAPAFLTDLQTQGVGNSTFGFAVPAGAGQTLTLPWNNIDRVSVRFTENVVAGAGDLTVFGSAVPTYALTAAQFSYDAATFTATWAFAAPVGADRLRLSVASGPAALRATAGGEALDGEWLDGTATFNSGDGQAGTDFSFQFNVLPGDVTLGGTVNVTDLVRVNQFISNGTGGPSYLVDVNGSGAVNVTDLTLVNQKITAGAVSLPAGPPGGTPGSGWVAPTTPTSPSPPGVAGTTVTASNVDSLLTDVDGDGQADPGDTIRYTIIITNVSLAPDATGVTLTDTLDPRMTLVAGSVNVSPQAVNDAYTWVGNTFLDSAARALPSLFANDIDFLGDTTLTLDAFDATSTQGGTVTVAANGAFTYLSPVGFTGTDTFTYRVKDAGGLTSTATVTMTVGGRVWYVQNAATSGNGRSNNPFNSPAAASTAADAATDIIYVFSDVGANPSLNGLFTLDAGQQLLGQGVGLTVNSINLFTAGTSPVVTNTTGNGIQLAQDNTVSGLTLGHTSGVNLTGTAIGTLTMNAVSKTGTGRALEVSAGGTMAVTFDSLASTSSSGGAVVNLNGVGGSLAVNNAAGTDTSIAGASAGISIINAVGPATFSFGDTNISTVGTGLNLGTSGTATTSFASLAVTTTAGAGIVANFGGTLTIGGTANTVSATGGPALNLTSTTLGGGGATFASVISSGSPTRGINLNAVTGNLTANGGTITGSVGTAFARTGGSAADTYNGTITVTNGQTGVSVSNPTSGSLTLGTVNVSNTGAANSNDAVSIDGNAAAAFDVTIASATLNATNMSDALSVGDLVSGSDVTITSGTLTAASAGDRVVRFATALNANVNLSGVTLMGTNSDGLDFTSSVAGTYQFGAYTANTPNGGIALEVTAGTAAVTFASLTQSGGTTAVSIGGATTGAVTINGGAISGTSGTDFSIAGVAGATGNVTYAGTINNAAGNSVVVSFKPGGTVTFSGAITTTAGGISLTNNGGATINLTGGLSLTTTTNAAFTATGGATVNVTGASNTVTTTTGTALNLSGITIGTNGMTFATVNTSGAAQGIVVNNVGQAGASGLTVGGGTIANATTNGVFLDTVSANVSIAAGISSTATGRTVNVEDSGSTAVGGNQITFSGAIDENGVGIRLFNNDANNDATVTFSGSLDIDTAVAALAGFLSQEGGNVSVTGQMDVNTTAGNDIGVNLVNNGTNTISFNSAGTGLDITSGGGTGYRATGGGTVTVEGSGNTVTATSGTGVNITNTTIGSNGVTFQSISSGAGVNPGIVLNTTGAGFFTVTGTGNDNSDNTSGGTITGKNGAGDGTDGIQVTNATNVSFNHMTITNNNGHGIFGVSVNGFRLHASLVSENANQLARGTAVLGFNNEGNVHLINVSGTAIGGTNPTSITHSTITNAFEHDIEIDHTTGTLTDFQITNSTISNDGGSGQAANRVLIIQNGAGSSASLTVQDSTLDGNRTVGALTAQGIQGTTSAGTLTVNAFRNTLSDHNIAVDVSTATSGVLVFDISNNGGTGNVANNGVSNGIITGSDAIGINVFTNANSTGSVTGKIRGNTVGTQGVAGSGSAVGRGIQLQNEGSINMTVLISGNIVQSVAGNQEINVQHGIAVAGAAGTSNVTITGNTLRDNTSTSFPLNVEILNSGTLNVSISGNTFSNNVGQGGGASLLRMNDPASGGTMNVTQLTPTGAANANELDDANGLSFAAGQVTVSGAPNFNQPPPTLPPQFAAGGYGPGGPGVTTIRSEQVVALLAEAIHRWEMTGLSASDMTRLHGVTVRVTELPDTYLGAAPLYGNSITLDLDAAGYGWFVDQTPADDSEFRGEHKSGLSAVKGPAAGGMDLLTVVMHELGHVLGLDSNYAGDPSDLMYAYLGTGERRLPGVVPTDRADKSESVGRREDSSPAAGKRADAPPPASVSSVATDWWGVALTPRRTRPRWSFASALDPIALD